LYKIIEKKYSITSNPLSRPESNKSINCKPKINIESFNSTVMVNMNANYANYTFNNTKQSFLKTIDFKDVIYDVDTLINTINKNRSKHPFMT